MLQTQDAAKAICNLLTQLQYDSVLVKFTTFHLDLHNLEE